MLNLYARKLGGSGTVALDLMEDQPISVSLQFQTLQDANTVGGSFSQNFRIPASKTNSDFFDHWEGVGETSTTFNPKSKSEAWITDNGIPILQGALQLISVVKVNGRPKHYEVLVVGSTGGLITDVGNLKLSELEWDDLDHPQSSNELQGLLVNNLAQESNIDQSYGGCFAYGLMDKHPGYTNYQATPIKNYELTPFLKVRKVLDAIFAQSDSSYNSTFFSSGEGDDIWMPIHNGKKDLNAQNFSGPAECHASLDVVTDAFQGGVVGEGLTIPTLDGVTCGNGTVHPLPLNEESDPNNVFNASTDAFTAPVTRAYTFVIVGKKINRSEAFTNMRVRLKKNSSTVVHDELLMLNEPTFNPQPFNFTVQIPLQQNDTITLEIFTPSPNPSEVGLRDLDFYQEDATATSTALNNVDIAGAMPNITCQAFLEGLQRAFNLVFVPNEHNGTFQIEPAEDFLNTGDPLDWSKKVDLSTDMQILPTTDLQSRVYEFNHAEAADLMNDSFVTTAGRIAGRMRIEDTDNDWATGTNSIETCFAPFIAVDTNLGFPGFIAYNADGEFDDDNAPPMLCYLNSTSFSYQHRVDIDGTIIQRSTMCLFTPFSQAPSQDTSKGLLFGPDTFRANDVQPENTLFNTYWGNYFRSLYFQESKILKCKMFLNRTDINQLDFRDTIHLREGVFRVLSITNYTANAEETCDVELLQTAGDVRLCEFTNPRGQVGGLITFTDATGQSGRFGSKKCCEYYGFTWNGSRCVSQVIIGPDNPPPTGKDVVDVITVLGEIDTSKPISDFTDAIQLNASRTEITGLNLSDSAIAAEKIETDGDRNFVNQQELATIGTDTTARATANAAKGVTDLISTDSEGITGFTKGDGVTILDTADIGESSGRTFLTTTNTAKLDKLAFNNQINVFNLDTERNRISNNKLVTDRFTTTGVGSGTKITGIDTTNGTLDVDNARKLDNAVTFNGNFVSTIDTGSGESFDLDDGRTKMGYINTGSGGITSLTTTTGGLSLTDVYTFFDSQSAYESRGVTGDRVITITSDGAMGEVADGTSGQFLQTNGAGVFSFASAGGGWHGNTTLIKVSPTEWVGNDLGRAITQVRIEDDTTNTLGVQINQSTGTIFAFNEIPTGYKATHVKVHASSTVTNGVEVLHYNTTTGATSNSTTGNTNTNINITDMTSSTTNMLVISVTPGATTVFVYSAEITIAAV